MSDNKSINIQAFFNILSTVLLTGINFITIPIFTRLLGAEQYGYYSVFYSWSAIINVFMGLQTHTSLAIARYDYKENFSGYKKNILFFGTLISVCFVLCGILLKNILSNILGFPQTIIVLMFIFAFFSYIINFMDNLLLYDKKAKQKLFLSIVVALASAGLSYYLIVNKTFNPLYVNRICGVVFPYVAIGSLVWIYLFFSNRGKFDKNQCKYALAYGFPIVFHLLSHEILNQTNKLMMQYLGFAGAAVGVFSFYQSFNSILSVILNALNTSWHPFYNDDLNNKDFDNLNRKTKNYIELFSIIICGFILLSREVVYLFANEEFWGGMNIIPVLATGVYLTFMYQFAINFEYFNKKTKMISIGTISAGITNILFNYLLIPKMGMYGAALATLISYIILFAVHTFIAKGIKEMKYHIHLSDFAVGIVSVLFSILLFYLLSDTWVIRWIIGIVLGVYELHSIYERKSIF